MKVLSLWQPWASLVALGLKTIETRSWSTKYRGPLAIHAGARKPRNIWAQERPDLYDPIVMERHLEITEDAHGSGSFLYEWRGPLGAIVATCTLVDVVPIFASDSDGYRAAGFTSYVFSGTDRLRLCDWALEGWGQENPAAGRYGGRFVEIDDQRPYGDYRTPPEVKQRYAWLLADVVPVDPPAPFKGGQGLTKSWEPAAA